MIDQKALNQQLERLDKEIENFDDEQVFKISDNILGKTPDDKEVKLAKIVAQLRLSKFENLESLFPKNPSLNDGPELAYSYAYFLYKKARYDECLTLVQKGASSNTEYKKAFTLLEAQIRYKKGDILAAARIYLSVLEEDSFQIENTETLANLFNCLAQIPPDQTNLLEKTLKLSKEFLSKNEDSLIREFFYNLALLYSNIGNFNLAKDYLERFKQIMDRSDDADEIEGQQDLVMYEIQYDFITSFLYDLSTEESESRFQRYASKIEMDVNNYYKIALKNNMIAYKDKSKELGDSIKRIDEIIKVADKGELTPYQILDLKVNKLILYLIKSKYAESNKLIEEIEKTYQPNEYLGNDKYVSCKYFLLFRTKKYKEVEDLNQHLLSQLDKLSTTSKLPLLLVNGEINRLFGNQKALIENLTRIMDLDKQLAKNSAISALIMSTLSKNLNLVSDFRPVIKTIQDQTQDVNVILQIAELYTKEKNHQQAINLYQQVLTSDKNNVKALEKLSYLYSFTDLKKAEEYLQRIPQADIITDPTEIRRLEVDYLPTKGTKVEEQKTVILDASKKIKKTRKRKPRYPKGFDPSNPGKGPDPERWLPRLERSKNKKIAKKKGLLTRTQGVTAGQESVQTFQKGPSTANQEVSTSGAGKKKNKKKK